MEDLALELAALIQKVQIRAHGAPLGWKKDCLTEVNEWLSIANKVLVEGVEMEACAESLIKGLEEMVDSRPAPSWSPGAEECVPSAESSVR